MIHHDDFWDVISSQVYIHRDEVKLLTENAVLMEDGGKILCDAIVCGTGWVPSLQFFDNAQLLNLGLPTMPQEESNTELERWDKLFQEADKEICLKFPLLANPPKHPHQQPSTTTYRLYQGMAPVEDSSILFINHLNTGNMLMCAEAQSLWAVAYFDKKLTLPAKKDIERNIATWVAFSRRRYLSNGELENAINFETITYVDALLKEMGLSAHEKGWWKQWFEPFRPSDLGKAWTEYLNKNNLGRVGNESTHN